jgi:hypothetical protein
MKARVLKLIGITRELEKGSCPLCIENEDVKHMLVS